MSNLATQPYKDKRRTSCNPHKAITTLGGDYDLEAAWSSEPFLNLARTILWSSVMNSGGRPYLAGLQSRHQMCRERMATNVAFIVL